MKYLVLGGSGQLGREWADLLKERGVVFESKGSSEVDITQEPSLVGAISRFQPDVVINCAAFTDVDGAEEHKNRSLEVNSKAVEVLAGICDGHNIKLVHYSTDYIFPGLEEDRERFPNGYPEDMEPEPVNWYGETKLRGENAIREQMDDFLIIRTSWLCGRYGGNFVKTMINLGEERASLSIVNDQWGSPSFAEYVVYNSFNLINKRKKGIYNVTSEGLTTWHGFAGEIFEQAGIEVELTPITSSEFPQKAKRPRYSKLDIEKLKGVQDSEIIDWKEGLSRLLNEL